MAKEKITFDQLFITNIYNEILALNDNVENFKVVNDMALYEEEIDSANLDYSVILLKTYGGTRTALPNFDATSLQTQIIINTDDVQRWKRILNEMIDKTNGKWQNISFDENADYEAISYNYFQNLNAPSVLQSYAQSGTSTRYTISSSGTIFYTTMSNLSPSFEIEIKIDNENEKVENLLTGSLAYSNQLESYMQNNSATIKNRSKGAIRTIGAMFLFDQLSTTHNFFINRFFDDTNIDQPIEIKISLNGSEYTLSSDFYIETFNMPFRYGDTSIIEIKLVESGV